MAIESLISEFADYCGVCAEMAIMCWRDSDLAEAICGDCAERLAEAERTLLHLELDRPTFALIARNP
ncbi:MAG: hypothetical protein JO333_11425 [Verrucomicrobia bacterium]|nr:hypothetical protein [Verrucomicrobiota bacterium]